MPAHMSAGDHSPFLADAAEIESVRETAKQAAADVAVDNREQFRGPFDHRDPGIEDVQKHSGHRLASGSVPPKCLGDISSRRPSDDKRHA